MDLETQLYNYFTELEILEEGQFKVYYALLVNNLNKKPGLRASEIAKITGLNRTYIYNVIANLKEKDLINLDLTTPNRYYAKDPSYFIRKTITLQKTRLAKLSEFIEFIELNIKPVLMQKSKETIIPLKSTFFINSLPLLKNLIKDNLIKCKNRMYFLAPMAFLKDIESSLELSIKKLERFQNRNFERKEIRFISNIHKGNNISCITKYLINLSGSIQNIIIVIDDSTFTFDSESKGFGMGILIESKKISNSYIHKLEHRWKEKLYASLPKSTIESIPEDIRKDTIFLKVLQTLFKQDKRIVPQECFTMRSEESYVSYLKLFSFEKEFMVSLGEIEIQYTPLTDKSKATHIIEELYNRNKLFFQGRIENESERDKFEFKVQEYTKTIHGFDCLVFSIQYKVVDSSWYLGKNNAPENILFESNPFKLSVFNYYNRAVIAIWAIMGNEVDRIIELLKKK